MKKRHAIYEDDASPAKVLRVWLPWCEEFTRVAHDENIKHLIVNDDIQGPIPPDPVDLSFIPAVPWIEDLALAPMREILDLTPLAELEDLTTLTLSATWQQSFDWRLLRALADARLVEGPDAERVFENETVRRVGITSRVASLDELPAHESLRSLHLTGARLSELVGLGRFPTLGTLILFNCRKLTSLAGLSECPRLRSLEVSRCPVRDIREIGCARELGGLACRGVGELPNLQPLEACTLLRSVSLTGSTNVLDGDLSLLLRLPNILDVFVRGRRHYSHTNRELTRIIEARW